LARIESLRFAAALILLLRFGAEFFLPLTLAHLALAAAAILALAAALILRLGAALAAAMAGAPRRRPSSLSSDWTFSLIAAARRSCRADRLVMDEFIVSLGYGFWPEKSMPVTKNIAFARRSILIRL